MDKILPYIQHPDFAFSTLFLGLVCIFYISGRQNVYRMLLGAILGFFLFLLFSNSFDTLLSFLQDSPAKQFFISKKTLIQSQSVYLVFIFSFGVALNKWCSFPLASDNEWLVRAKNFILAFWFTIFLLSLIIGIGEKISFFRQQGDTIFSLLTHLSWWKEKTGTSFLYTHLLHSVNIVILSTLLLVFYQLSLSQLVHYLIHKIQKMLQYISEKIAASGAKNGGNGWKPS